MEIKWRKLIKKNLKIKAKVKTEALARKQIE
jgi:hypothetical protein